MLRDLKEWNHFSAMSVENASAERYFTKRTKSNMWVGNQLHAISVGNLSPRKQLLMYIY